MKKKITLTFYFLYFVNTLFLYSDSNNFAPNTYEVSVSAVSNGKQKNIISKINGKKVQNKIILTVKTDSSENIIFESNNFKLGKMPVSSSIVFVLLKENINKNNKGEYILNNIQGNYKVLSSKRPAFISGTISQYSCSLVLKTSRKDKKLEIKFSY